MIMIIMIIIIRFKVQESKETETMQINWMC